MVISLLNPNVVIDFLNLPNCENYFNIHKDFFNFYANCVFICNVVGVS